MLASAQRERFVPNLALALAQATPIGAYPLLDYLVLTSDTLGAGVRQLARYFRPLGGPVDISIREDGDPVRIEMAGGGPFSIEYNAALTILRFCNETDGRFVPPIVSLQHEPDDLAAFERAWLPRPVLGRVERRQRAARGVAPSTPKT